MVLWVADIDSAAAMGLRTTHLSLIFESGICATNDKGAPAWPAHMLFGMSKESW